MSSDFHDEPSLIIEPVERREAPRGPIPGLAAFLPGDAEPSRVVEAGLAGIFVACDDLERFAPGERFDIRLSHGAESFTVQVEVVRCESDARHGYALRVVTMSEEARAAFERLLS